MELFICSFTGYLNSNTSIVFGYWKFGCNKRHYHSVLNIAMVKNTVQCVRTQSQRGVTLIELLVASAIFGAIGIIFVNAIATGQTEAYRVERMSEAESVARSQIELIKSLPYSDDDSYPSVTGTEDRYTAEIEVIDVSPVEYPNTIQKIIVTVSLNSNPLLSLETLKVKR